MTRKIAAFLITTLLILSLPSAAFAESSWLSLGNAAVDEMFTERDFDPSYVNAVDITLADCFRRLFRLC